MSGEWQRHEERRWAYVLLRLGMGIDFFGHGFIRIYHGVSSFAAWMVTNMSGAPLLPAGFLHVFGLVLPWIELTVGLLMLIGVGVRGTLIAASLLMLCLMTGSGLKQDWGGVSLQLTYLAILAVLLFLRYDYDAGWRVLLAGRAEKHE